MDRSAVAVWQGDLKSGRGSITGESGALRDTPYSFATRFEDTPGTNPEELIAAAHAACFSMALAGEIQKRGLEATRIHTEAKVRLEKRDDQWTVTRSHLKVRVQPSASPAEAIEQAAHAAKSGCPISRLLDLEITMDLDVAD